ncbi:MAG TPA: hypothetical protein VMY05_01855, partial [Acidobacteriota bacterium]|nr:hypothetical protein [Acidobacteriota bacterium]
MTHFGFKALIILFVPLSGSSVVLPPFAQVIARQYSTGESFGDKPNPETFDGLKEVITRWVDPYGRSPINYEEWKSSQTATDPFQYRLVSSVDTKRQPVAGSRF